MTYAAAGPYQACTVQGGCLGDGAFVCQNAICTAAGGYLQPCRPDSTCTSGQDLYCAASDGLCHRTTSCDPQCDPNTQGCLSYVVNRPGMSYGAYQCVDTTGSAGETCLADGTCKDDSLSCESSSNTCKSKVASSTSTAPVAAPTTCTPACESTKQVCSTFTTNSGTTYACQAAGARGQPCLGDGTCSTDRLQCNAENTCEAKPQTTCEPACSAAQVCQQQNFNTFTCIAAGALGQLPYVNGTCNAGLLTNSTTGFCDLLPAGAVCTADAQCSDKALRCLLTGEGSGTKTCSAAGLSGLACSRTGKCDSSSYCYNVTDTCNAFGKVGDACPGGVDSQCVGPLQCRSKVCSVVGALRTPCFSNSTCSGTDLTCDMTSSTCLYSSAAGVGATCIQQADCASSLRCTLATNGTSTCLTAGTNGNPCLTTGGCSDNSTCVSDVCRAWGGINATCSDIAPCVDGTACLNVTVPLDTTSTQSTSSRRRDLSPLMNLGTRPLAPWHPVWMLPRDDIETTPAHNTTTVQQCVRLGYVNDTCFSNSTCRATGGAVCNTTSMTCGVYHPKVNESCTQEGVLSPTGNVTCDSGLRCTTSTNIVKISGKYGFQNVSTCQPAGDLSQRCLLNQTDSTLQYCNAGMTCSSNTTAGRCLKNLGESCAVANITQCISGTVCSASSKTCISVGGLDEGCISDAVCNAGLRCINSTGTPTCKTRNNATCEDFSTYNLTRICPECDTLCTLSVDSETVSCSFPAGTPYNFMVPRGIDNVTVIARSGAGGNGTIYAANFTGINTTMSSNSSTTDDPTSTSNSTATPAYVILNGTAYLNNTNTTVPLYKNGTTFGGVGASLTTWMMLVANRTYSITAGGIGNQYQGGYNGGGMGYYDNATNSSSGGGGGRTELIDTFNGTRLVCLGGGGGGGYLWGGGAAMTKGNGTEGFGLPGASNSTLGMDSAAIGLGAGGGGCNGGTAAFKKDSGAGGGGGNSNPTAGVVVADYTHYGNVTLKLSPSSGFVGLSFACPVSTY